MSEVSQSQPRRAGKKVRSIDKVSLALGQSVEDVEEASGQSSKSVRLSHAKRMLDMKDGDEHFNVGETSVAPINDMYIRIKAMALYPEIVSLRIPLVN
jgi:cell division ATPase FtsA